MMTPERAMELVVERMKREIWGEVATGRIPKTVRRFSQLHDYIDANELGGFCDNEWLSQMYELFGGPGDDDEWMYSEQLTDFTNEAQDTIDMWLQAGGLR